jgi:hypothetical protein
MELLPLQSGILYGPVNSRRLGKSLLYEKRQRARIYDVDGSTLSSRSYTLLKFVQFTDKNVIRTERKVKRGRARA